VSELEQLETLFPFNGKVARLLDEICRLWRSAPMIDPFGGSLNPSQELS
jgi:hypothetical protein